MKQVNGVMNKRFLLKKKRLMAAAAAMMLSASCALAQPATVVSGDPAVTMSLHDQPSASSQALGHFFSGTQVEILSQSGDWAQITIGTGSGIITGYAPANALGMGAGVDATRNAKVISPYGTQSVVLRDRPSNSYHPVAMLAVGENVLVIGEMNEFCFVRTSSGCVGCLLAGELR